MQCPRCLHENPSRPKYCAECGTPLTSTGEGSPVGASYAELQDHLKFA